MRANNNKYLTVFNKTVQTLKELAKNNNDEEYMRNQLWKDYDKHNLDPDGSAVMCIEDIKCTGDALLSIQRICRYEDDIRNIIPTYIKYREKVIFYFPSELGGINTTRATVLGDKIDWLLFDLKKYYSDNRKDCLLLQTYNRPKTNRWLENMKSFENIVNSYGLMDVFVNNEYEVIDIETGGILKDLTVTKDNKKWSKNYYNNLKIILDKR